jgi:hypothetical protein
MKRILSDKDITQCTLYFRFYLMNALKKAGMADQYLDHLGIWKQMLAQGLTTFPETDRDARSDCHAWSSSPMVEFLATVCGIEPAEPGFRRVRIQPHLGALTEAMGVVPHPLGDIRVMLKKKGAGVSAQVTLPPGLTGEFIWNNEKIALTSGTQTVNK